MFEISSNQEGVIVLTMVHGKVNAMDLEFCANLSAQLQNLENSADCRAAIITAPGRVFSAGVDLVRLINESESYLDEFLPALVQLFKDAFSFSKPLIGLINGHAIAGGCVLACTCDYRVVHPKAKIGIPELRVGVPFPTTGLEIMRFTARDQSFRQIVNNGKTFAGEDVLEAGLGDELQEPEASMAAATKIASELILIPAQVFSHTKKHIRSVAWERIKRGEVEFEPAVEKMWRSPEIRAAVKDYVGRTLQK